MGLTPAIHSREEHIKALVLAGAILIVLPLLPLGNLVLYPFMILSTWFHEMGHGMAAVMVGYDFERLVLFPDGSGVAESYGPLRGTRLKEAAISAAGPIGPAIIGSLLIIASAHPRAWKPALFLLAAAIALSTVIWVDGLTGWIVLPLIATALVAIGLKGTPWLDRFALQLLGLQAALSMFAQWDYLLMEQADIGGGTMLSDTGQLEAALLLPHWVWAIGIIALAALMIGASLRYALSDRRTPSDWTPRRVKRRP
ncbi:M50 family metallopeptidase [Altererythrobacter sp. MTPC7]|uniref:M50 family metallopeptidase n=1 Tax=Altererythrobacter sp. MTPC7 TaxID=3056567 RepID=UPI0036F2B7B0